MKRRPVPEDRDQRTSENPGQFRAVTIAKPLESIAKLTSCDRVIKQQAAIIPRFEEPGAWGGGSLVRRNFTLLFFSDSN